MLPVLNYDRDSDYDSTVSYVVHELNQTQEKFKCRLLLCRHHFQVHKKSKMRLLV